MVTLADLSTKIQAGLNERCPSLTLEQRSIFAVQIAIAEVRRSLGKPSASALDDLERNN